MNTYRSLHLAPEDFPPHPHPRVEPLCRPNPAKEVFFDSSPSYYRRGSSSSVVSANCGHPPPLSFLGALHSAIGKGYQGGRLSSSNSTSGY